MKVRTVIPEILDSLPPDSPDAIRSRRDLRLVNGFMGNYRWIARRMRRLSADLPEIAEWVEVGAGDGELARRFAPEETRALRVSGLDLVPEPRDWPDAWSWRQGDVFEGLGNGGAGPGRLGFVANLFLHHFESDALGRIGEVIERDCCAVVISEPARYRFFEFGNYGFYPFVNSVTRHDGRVSIRAGFRPGELSRDLGLGNDWEIRETVTPFGAYHFLGCRREKRPSRS